MMMAGRLIRERAGDEKFSRRENRLKPGKREISVSRHKSRLALFFPSLCLDSFLLLFDPPSPSSIKTHPFEVYLKND